MKTCFCLMVVAVLVAGCTKPSQPVPGSMTSSPAMSAAATSVAPPPITSVAKLKGIHGGTVVQLMPANIDAEILVEEAISTVIVLGVFKGELLQDLWFDVKTHEGDVPSESFRGEKRDQFGISHSWVFKSDRLVELLKQGREGRLALSATTPTGPQTTAEFLAVEITWPATKSNNSE
jgi:hypothetical protein